MENREIIITNKDQIIPTHKNEHEPYEYYKYEVTNRKHGNQCYVSIYEIPPKKAGYPYHYHMKNEEVFYIISGTGVLETPSGNKIVNAGDIIVCPPEKNGAHRLFNNSEIENLVYLDCDVIHSPEVVHYPHSKKVGIIINGEPSNFYKRDSHVDYYEGE